jgi:hypothetical protein
MPTWHEVTRIVRADSATAAAADRHTRITHLCGAGANGKPWRLAVHAAIEGMLASRWGFFVVIDGRRHDLIIASDPAGVRYVKTRLDQDGPATLLALREYEGHK